MNAITDSLPLLNINLDHLEIAPYNIPAEDATTVCVPAIAQIAIAAVGSATGAAATQHNQIPTVINVAEPKK